MKKALKVTPEFETELMDVEDNFLSKMQEAVGGLIQPIDYNETLTIWVNEEFYSLENPTANFIATTFYSNLGSNQVLLGNAVFTGGTDENGEVIGLDDETYEQLLEVVAEAKRLVVA